MKKEFLVVFISALFANQIAQAVDKDKSIPCDDKKPRVVRVAMGRVTVLNFPFKPKDVVPGSQAFDFKQIKNDLVIMAIKPNAHTNAVVYLEDRRCVFDLIAVKIQGDDVLVVKDSKDSQYEVKFHE
jgi:hypothetical protein